MRVESASQSRARSVSRPPRDEMGVKDVVVSQRQIFQHNDYLIYISIRLLKN